MFESDSESDFVVIKQIEGKKQEIPMYVVGLKKQVKTEKKLKNEKKKIQEFGALYICIFTYEKIAFIIKIKQLFFILPQH